MISIRQPLCFSEIGKKETQEDFLFPSHADIHTRVFILCDGMGGHDNGEVASKTAATALGNYLSSYPAITYDIFEEGLSEAYNALDKIDTNSVRKPGTTMTALCLNDDSYLVAHIGDSRIYHVRPSLYNAKLNRGGILYQSSDHSLVNDLLKAGELTEEEARNFPQKNIITRAMQPHLQRRYKADVFMFDNIESGDYFFLCCDGILEQLDNNTLCRILANPKTDDKQKLAEIKAICDDKTRDNYTCWLIPIDKVEISVKSSNYHIIEANLEENDFLNSSTKKANENSPTDPKNTVSVVLEDSDRTPDEEDEEEKPYSKGGIIKKHDEINNEKTGKRFQLPKIHISNGLGPALNYFSNPTFKKWFLRGLYLLIAILIVVGVVIYFFRPDSKSEKPDPVKTTVVKEENSSMAKEGEDTRRYK